VLREVLLSVSRSEPIRDLSTSLPVTRDIVNRFVAGEQIADVVAVSAELVSDGLSVTIDRLGEDVTEISQAEQTREDYLHLLDSLDRANLTADAEVSVKLSALGQSLPVDGELIALDNALAICVKAAEVGTTVTLDMEDHTTTDSTLSILRELRGDFPWVGAVLQAYLFRTEGDCRDLAHEGSRVRLSKGAYREPESVAFSDRREIDLAYVRCMKILLSGEGYPMLATHDPRLIEVAKSLTTRYDRPKGSYEFQMLHGVRPDEQRYLSAEGETTRVYLPYGEDWYGYMVRRMAEKPGNLALFMRSMTSTR